MTMDKKSRDSKNNLQNRVLGETFNQNQKYPIVKGFRNTCEIGRCFGKNISFQNQNYWIPVGYYQKVPLTFTFLDFFFKTSVVM